MSSSYLGQQGSGGADAQPTPEIPASNLITVAYSTSSVDVSTIALALLEHGATTFMDANGNPQVQNGRWIAYDFENRPIRIVTQDGTLVQFAYDFQGNRTQQSVTPLYQSSETTTYIGGIYETSGASATIKYITAGTLRVAMVGSGATTYFLPDNLGSTILLTNSGQSTVRSDSYLPFGGTFQTSGSIDNDHKFTGQRLDAPTGYYYRGARYGDPFLGQFAVGGPIGVLTPVVDAFDVGFSAGYIAGPNSNASISVTDGVNSGTLSDKRQVSFARFLVEPTLNVKLGETFAFHMEAGLGVASGQVKETVTCAGSACVTNGNVGTNSSSWTGFSWEVFPYLSFNRLLLGVRYAGFPEFKGNSSNSKINWSAFGLFTGLKF